MSVFMLRPFRESNRLNCIANLQEEDLASSISQSYVNMNSLFSEYSLNSPELTFCEHSFKDADLHQEI